MDNLVEDHKPDAVLVLEVVEDLLADHVRPLQLVVTHVLGVVYQDYQVQVPQLVLLEGLLDPPVTPDAGVLRGRRELRQGMDTLVPRILQLRLELLEPAQVPQQDQSLVAQIRVVVLSLLQNPAQVLPDSLEIELCEFQKRRHEVDMRLYDLFRARWSRPDFR